MGRGQTIDEGSHDIKRAKTAMDTKHSKTSIERQPNKSSLNLAAQIY